MRSVILTFLIGSLVTCTSSCDRTIKPEILPPPQVDCIQGSTAQAPAWPQDWLRDGPAFAITILGLLTEERGLRGKEHACIGDLKKRGVIR